MPFQNNEDCARIESLFHLPLRRKFKCDYTAPDGKPRNLLQRASLQRPRSGRRLEDVILRRARNAA
jgi:hypothetical protein